MSASATYTRRAVRAAARGTAAAQSEQSALYAACMAVCTHACCHHRSLLCCRYMEAKRASMPGVKIWTELEV